MNSRISRILVQWIRRIIAPTHLKRTLMISLVVCIWLTAFNQYNVIMEGKFTVRLAVKIFLNFLTPFVVSNAGLISFEENQGDSE